MSDTFFCLFITNCPAHNRILCQDVFKRHVVTAVQLFIAHIVNEESGDHSPGILGYLLTTPAALGSILSQAASEDKRSFSCCKKVLDCVWCDIFPYDVRLCWYTYTCSFRTSDAELLSCWILLVTPRNWCVRCYCVPGIEF